MDLLGIDSLTSTFGLLVLFRGIASVLGPPLGGLVYESTNQGTLQTLLVNIIIDVNMILMDIRLYSTIICYLNLQIMRQPFTWLVHSLLPRVL